jgi:hypothetical protein
MVMLTISTPCARCSHPKSIHHVVYGEPPVNQPGTARREVLLQCSHCGKHTIAVLEAVAHIPLDPSRTPFRGDITQYSDHIKLLSIIPDMPVNEAPEHVDLSVAKAFIDGLDVLQVKKWTLAAGSFRTALDRATKILWDEPKDGVKAPQTLAARIKELGTRMGIASSLIEWANNVRVVGNEIHELGEVSEEDAMDAAHFTEMFLIYTFTLPRQVADFRVRRKP